MISDGWLGWNLEFWQLDRGTWIVVAESNGSWYYTKSTSDLKCSFHTINYYPIYMDTMKRVAFNAVKSCQWSPAPYSWRLSSSFYFLFFLVAESQPLLCFLFFYFQRYRKEHCKHWKKSYLHDRLFTYIKLTITEVTILNIHIYSIV